ncbi:MAG: hypothetical protein PF637_01350 [Spirochaetes bacterium]|jgi:hypothetical protein|nr:hypothetical protein [Spirochaetota bacterium]
MQKINVLLLFLSGFRLANRNVLLFLRVNLLLFSIIFFLSYCAAVASIKITYDRKLQELIVLALSFPFLSYLFAGTIYYYLSYFKGLTVRLNQIYMGFCWIKNFLKLSFVLLIVYQIIIIPIFSFYEYELEEQIRVGTGALFFLWFIIRNFFLPILFVDYNRTFEDQLFKSLSLSKGYVFHIILFLLIAFIIFLLGAAFAGFGMLYSISVIILAYMKFYHLVRSNEIEKV